MVLDKIEMKVEWVCGLRRNRGIEKREMFNFM